MIEGKKKNIDTLRAGFKFPKNEIKNGTHQAYPTCINFSTAAHNVDNFWACS